MKVADLFARLSLKPDVKSFEMGDKLLTRVKQGVAGLLAYASVSWAKGLISQTVELGGAIADLSQKVGVPAETLQQLGYAAQLSGGSMESLGNSLGKLAKLASDAGKGSKEASSTFSKMGIKVKETDGSLRPVEDLLGDIAEHIASLPDGTEKTAKAMAVFGRSGKDLIPLLNEGREGIDELRKEFVDLGAQIDGETASSLEEFGDQQDKIGVALDGIRNQLVIGILPHLKEMVETWVQWFKVNRLIIKQRIDTLLKILVPIFKLVAKFAGIAFDVIGGLIDLIYDWGRNLKWFWDNFQVAIGGAIGMFLALKAASVSAALASAAAWALPLAAIAAIALVGNSIFRWAQGKDSAIGDIHKGLVRMFVDAIAFWSDAIGGFFDRFWAKIDETAKRFRDILPEEVQKFLGIDSDATNERDAERRAAEISRQQNIPIELARSQLAGDSERQRLNKLGPFPLWTNQNVEKPEYNFAGGNVRTQTGIATRQAIVNATINVNGGNGDPITIAKAVQDQINGLLKTANAATTE